MGEVSEKRRKWKISLAAFLLFLSIARVGRTKARSSLDSGAIATLQTHPRERRSTRRVVQDLLDDALNVAVPLGRVERAERGRPFTVRDVGREDRPAPLTLSADDAAHGVCDSDERVERETGGSEWAGAGGRERRGER